MFAATVITLFPDAFPGTLGLSLIGKSLRDGAWSLQTVQLRDFGVGPHKSVDDTPAGGGAGMVIRADVAAAAIDSVPRNERPLVYLSPRGEPFTQAMAEEWARGPGVVLFCGRFEGLDERVIEARGLMEVSLGDFVLSGGEPAAIALIDAAVRLLPGVMGAEETLEEESFEAGLLEYPHYTRPAEWCGRQVPDVLMSGHHEKIRAWRKLQAERTTESRRPDLWAAYQKRTAHAGQSQKKGRAS
jgi:tRNA (guanine37-N1)-methyltransferase